MNPSVLALPVQASTFAPRYDLLFFFLCGVTLFFSTLICSLIIALGIRYRRRPGHTISQKVSACLPLELAWTVIPLLLMLLIFSWGATLYIHASTPPRNALEISVVGKQWMWKIEHSDGRREINQLHVPIGQPVRLTMISQDVIHSLFVPAFRVKQDVLPGRYSTLWFEATQPGVYHLFCTQYCGTSHSAMIGEVVAMTPTQFAQWMAGAVSTSSPAAEGRKLFENLACVACHDPGAALQAPRLEGLYGGKVLLEGGNTVVANEDYLREAILDPGAKIVRGFQNIMPSFRGRVSEEELLQLIAYIKSIGSKNE